MMPILVKGDDVRSGTKAKACHRCHRSQWVKNALKIYLTELYSITLVSLISGISLNA